jgi:hypothetical protein
VAHLTCVARFPIGAEMPVADLRSHGAALSVSMLCALSASMLCARS